MRTGDVRSYREKYGPEQYILRKMLWLTHGCQGLYGDDGEMQCNRCHIDFVRDTVDQIEARFEDSRLRVGMAYYSTPKSRLKQFWCFWSHLGHKGALCSPHSLMCIRCGRIYE